MTPQQIKANAPEGSTHYAEYFKEWYIYLRFESRGYVCPHSGLLISECDLRALEIKPL